MKKAGDITITAPKSTGTWAYQPTAKVWYETEAHGVLADEFRLPLPVRLDRAQALRQGREWVKLPGAERALEDAWDLLHNHQAMGIDRALVAARIVRMLRAVSAELVAA